MTVRVQDMTPQARMAIKAQTSLGIRNATTDFRRIARSKTPFKTGDLANRVLEQVLGLSGTVAWQVVYAPYQERGRRADGSHVIRHRPGGGQTGFARTTAQTVAGKGQTYFGRAS